MVEAGYRCIEVGSFVSPKAVPQMANTDEMFQTIHQKEGVETGINLDGAIAVVRHAIDLVGHSADSYILRAGKSKDLIRELPTGQGKNTTKN